MAVCAAGLAQVSAFWLNNCAKREYFGGRRGYESKVNDFWF